MNLTLQAFLAASCVLALSLSASAQVGSPSSPFTLRADQVPRAVKHAGIYHVASGTWTRSGGAIANFGPDTVYSNTAPSGYFSGTVGPTGTFPLGTITDEGVIPTFANPNVNANRDSYTINCVSIGYCDSGGPGTSGWDLKFYSEYLPCTYDASYDHQLVVGGLPAGGCWTMDLNLSGGMEFCLAGDSGDGYQGTAALDSFGWSFAYAGTDGSMPAGFLLSGDPESTDPNWVAGTLPSDGSNTYFGVPSPCGPDQATGFFTQDNFHLRDQSGASSYCAWFGGYSNHNGCGGPTNPYSSWHLELQADAGVCDNFVSYPNGCTSNTNSTGVNSTMFAEGSASIAANNITLRAYVPPSAFGFFIVAQTSGFIANPGGSTGNICLGSNIGRFQSSAMSSGAAGEITLSTVLGQWDLASIPQASGSAPALPGTSAHFQCWHRDSSPAGPTSNFTDGCVVFWLP